MGTNGEASTADSPATALLKSSIYWDDGYEPDLTSGYDRL